MTTVLWTTWGRDWRREATPDTVVADVTRRYVDGGTVLLHDSDCTSYPGSWRSALGALPRLADEFAARGLTVGTVGDHGIDRVAGSPVADPRPDLHRIVVGRSARRHARERCVPYRRCVVVVAQRTDSRLIRRARHPVELEGCANFRDVGGLPAGERRPRAHAPPLPVERADRRHARPTGARCRRSAWPP